MMPEPRLDPAYSLRDFLDDQQRLLSSVGAGGPSPARTIEDVDARRLFLRLEPALRATRGGMRTRGVFLEKYGPGLAARRLARFRLVLEYLEGSHSRLCGAGLSNGHDPMAVCEDFVRFLLTWKLGPDEPRIPARVLSRFLDDWGHRWQ
jgi:hypothetical protein